jgi:hypothetical protein
MVLWEAAKCDPSAMGHGLDGARWVSRSMRQPVLPLEARQNRPRRCSRRAPSTHCIYCFHCTLSNARALTPLAHGGMERQNGLFTHACCRGNFCIVGGRVVEFLQDWSLAYSLDTASIAGLCQHARRLRRDEIPALGGYCRGTWLLTANSTANNSDVRPCIALIANPRPPPPKPRPSRLRP